MALNFQKRFQFCTDQMVRIYLKRQHSYSCNTDQRIMRILRWLRDQHPVGFGGRLHEVMCAYIGHDLRARIDGRAQLLLESVELGLASK